MARKKRKKSALTGPVRVLRTFTVNGKLYRKGTIVDASDPVVAGREVAFAPVIEQATAAPGEVRTTPARKKQQKPEEQSAVEEEKAEEPIEEPQEEQPQEGSDES